VKEFLTTESDVQNYCCFQRLFAHRHLIETRDRDLFNIHDLIDAIDVIKARSTLCAHKAFNSLQRELRTNLSRRRAFKAL